MTEGKELDMPETNAVTSPNAAKQRCAWANPNNPRYLDYHDNEWGVPCHDDRDLFELLVLEGFQAGLSWECILNKRPAFKRAFEDFDVEKVAGYDEEKVQKLKGDKGIVRNEGKIRAAITNARVFMQIQEERGSFDAYLWSFTEGKTVFEDYRFAATSALSNRVSADLKKRGMKYVGSTIVQSYLQATGILNAHEPGCYKYRKG